MSLRAAVVYRADNKMGKQRNRLASVQYVSKIIGLEQRNKLLAEQCVYLRSQFHTSERRNKI